MYKRRSGSLFVCMDALLLAGHEFITLLPTTISMIMILIRGSFNVNTITLFIILTRSLAG